MRQQQGIALIAALSVMVVVALLVFGTFFTTQIELWVTRNDVSATQAQYIAQTGLQRYKAALFQYFRFIEQTAASSTPPERTACFNRLGYGIDWSRNGSVTPWNGNRITMPDEAVFDASGRQIGRYSVTIVRDGTINHHYTIESVGYSSDAKSTLRATFEVRNSGVLEQAIFAGQGQGNKFINGNTTVRGGIHIVGNKNNPNQVVINSNGNFSQLNDYDLTDTTRYGDVGSRVTNGNRVATNLCANMRVQYGQVELSGSVQIGTPQNKLLGVYIGDNLEEDLIINKTLTECANNKGICTDPGQLGTFELGNDAPPFPTLDGAPDPTKCSLSTWRACIRADAQTNGLRVVKGVAFWPSGASFPGSGNSGTPPASCVAALDTDWGASGGKLTFDTKNVDCTFVKDGITQGFKYTYNPSQNPPGSFEVYGTVNLEGYHVVFERDTEYQARTYRLDGSKSDISGKKFNPNAAFVVERGNVALSTTGDIDLNGRMVTNSKGGNDGFPNHVLAFVAEQDIFQDGPQVMAPLYAGGTYRIVSKNVLVGSVIANYFCTTGAGGGSSNAKKNNSASSADKCNAGQSTEIVYVNTGENKPPIMRYMERAGLATFKVLSYEFR